jgi:hypothetical protein
MNATMPREEPAPSERALGRGQRLESLRIVRREQFGEVPDLERYAAGEVDASLLLDMKASEREQEDAAIDRLVAHLESVEDYDAVAPDARFAKDLRFAVARKMVESGIITRQQADNVRFYTAVLTQLSEKRGINGILQVDGRDGRHHDRLLLNLTHHPKDVRPGLIAVEEAPETDTTDYKEFVDRTATQMAERLESLMKNETEKAA